ncbi:MAG TPA: MFS transporter [Opitutaceae bacterium]|nr:MFS transporter [Opitutaceae bacterium]
MTGLLALAAGVTVANIYYNQSLLVPMAHEFHATAAAAGTIAVATQLGYATGLLLLVPLGDAMDRRKLIVVSASGAAILLLGVALAPSLPLAIAASYVLGLICVTPQFIIPHAAGLAPAERRGHVVGIVMSGLLVGILCARTFAGFFGAWFGWRAVFVAGAVFTGSIAWLMSRLPPAPPARPIGYLRLLGSLPGVLRREPVLQRHGIIGGLGFAAFSVFWTTLGFYLSARPEHFGSRAVGLFGLVAVAGATVAPIAGRLSDRLSARVVNGASLVVLIIGFVAMGAADRSLIVLVAAVFLMDAGVQANQISNQARIYSLAPELRNRVTSVYMVMYFIGGALGSAIGAQAWARWQWTGVWGSAAGLAALAFIPLFLIRTSVDRPRTRPVPVAPG